MTCELQFSFKNDNNILKLDDLKKKCQENPDFDLLNSLKGGKMKVVWPHTSPPVTGNVRAQLIHTRMHQKHADDHFHFKEKSTFQINELSWIWTLLITVPAVSYSLYTFLKWLGFDHQQSTLYGVLGGVASLLVEVILLMIQTFKQSQKENFQYNDKDSKQFIYNHRNNSIFSNHYSQTNIGQSLGKMKKD